MAYFKFKVIFRGITRWIIQLAWIKMVSWEGKRDKGTWPVCHLELQMCVCVYLPYFLFLAMNVRHHGEDDLEAREDGKATLSPVHALMRTWLWHGEHRAGTSLAQVRPGHEHGHFHSSKSWLLLCRSQLSIVSWLCVDYDIMLTLIRYPNCHRAQWRELPRTSPQSGWRTSVIFATL